VALDLSGLRAIPITQKVLGNIMGISRESTNNQLRL
jgi:hypothetical protein